MTSIDSLPNELLHAILTRSRDKRIFLVCRGWYGVAAHAHSDARLLIPLAAATRRRRMQAEVVLLGNRSGDMEAINGEIRDIVRRDTRMASPFDRRGYTIFHPVQYVISNFECEELFPRLHHPPDILMARDMPECAVKVKRRKTCIFITLFVSFDVKHEKLYRRVIGKYHMRMAGEILLSGYGSCGGTEVCAVLSKIMHHIHNWYTSS
jgi:hypothetical protein